MIAVHALMVMLVMRHYEDLTFYCRWYAEPILAVSEVAEVKKPLAFKEAQA